MCEDGYLLSKWAWVVCNVMEHELRLRSLKMCKDQSYRQLLPSCHELTNNKMGRDRNKDENLRHYYVPRDFTCAFVTETPN